MSSEVWDWDATPASNASTPPLGAPEGMDRPEVNDVIRQNMAAVLASMQDMPWLELAKHDAVRQGEARTIELLAGLLDAGEVSVRREAISALGTAPGPAVVDLWMLGRAAPLPQPPPPLRRERSV